MTRKAEDYIARLNANACFECREATEVEKHPRYGVRLCCEKCIKDHEKQIDDEAREIALAETFCCF